MSCRVTVSRSRTAPGALLPKRVGEVGPAARERSIEERLAVLVPRMEIRTMRRQELNHLCQARQFRVKVKHQRIASIVVRVRSRRVLPQQRRDAVNTVAPDGIEYGGVRQQVRDAVGLLVVEGPAD